MSGGLRRLAATVGTELLHMVTLGTLLALATALSPQVFGAGCLVFLAGGAVVLAHRHGRRRLGWPRGTARVCLSVGRLLGATFV